MNATVAENRSTSNSIKWQKQLNWRLVTKQEHFSFLGFICMQLSFYNQIAQGITQSEDGEKCNKNKNT